MPDALTDPKMSRPTSQEGVEILWKLQLRKEHAALLERANANAKYLEQLAAETNNNKRDFDERMAILEREITALKKEESKDRQGFEKYVEEMTVLKSQMGNAMNRLEMYDQQLGEVCTGGIKNVTISSQEEDAHFIDALKTPSYHPDTLTSLMVMRQQPPSSSKAPKTLLKPDQNTINEEHGTTEPAPHTSADLAGPIPRTRIRTRSQSVETSAPKQPQDQAPTEGSRSKAATSALQSTKISTPASQPFKVPRLHQGTSTLKNYLRKADSIYQGLRSPKEKKFEIEFIAAFIKGVRDADTKDTLVEELQQQHQSRRKRDGKVEILCAWEDVGEVMRNAAMLNAPEAASRSAPKSHKTKMTKELQGLLMD